MTRELKLALIVGFSLVLVVMVLVSDHLSKARKVELAPPTNETALAPKLPQVDPLNSTNGTPAQPAASDSIAANTGVADPLTINQGPSKSIEDQKSELANAAKRIGVALDDTKKTGGMVVPTETELTPPAPLADAPKFSDGVHPMGSESNSTTLNLPKNIRDARNSNLPGMNDVPVAEKAAVNEKIHLIESGQSLYSISKQYYGNSKYWKQLLDYNKATVKSETGLKVGMKIKVPDLGVLTGNPADSTVAKIDSAKLDPAKKESPVTKALAKNTKGKTYTVQKGDTPAGIAKKALGSSKRAHELMELNKIADDGGLKIGMVLQLPNE